MKYNYVITYLANNRLARHTSIYALGNALLRLGSFILLPLYTTYLTVSDFGVLELLSSTASILASFLGIGLAHATLRFYFEYTEPTDRKAVVSTSFLTSLFVSVPVFYAISHLNGFICQYLLERRQLTTALNILYITLTLELLRQIGLSYLRAREYSTLYVALCASQLVVQVAVNIYTVRTLKYGVTGVLMGNLVSVSVGALCCYLIILKDCGLRYSYRILFDLVKYSYPFLFSSISSSIFKNSDRFIMKAFISLHALGIYGLAMKFAVILNELILEPFQRSYGAYRFSEMRNPKARDNQARVFAYIVVLVTWVAIAICTFSHYFLRIFTAPAYYETYEYIPFVVFAVVVGSCTYIFQTGILVQKSTIHLFYIDMISQFTAFCLAFILIQQFGIFGACIAVICREILYSFLTNYFSQKLYPIRYDFTVLFTCLSLFIGYALISFLLASRSDLIVCLIGMALLVAMPLFMIKSRLRPLESQQ
jgi:O-antigen/teichoic acid export membrane protein